MIRILIVDDSSFVREMLTKELIKNGFEVVGEAENGKDAIKKYKQLKPDLVTMDMVMPKIEDIDGIVAIREIMKIDPQARIIMISAVEQDAHIIEAIQAGAKDYIVKPCSGPKVVDKIKQVLEETGLR